MTMQLIHDPHLCAWSIIVSGLVLWVAVVALLIWGVSRMVDRAKN